MSFIAKRHWYEGPAWQVLGVLLVLAWTVPALRAAQAPGAPVDYLIGPNDTLVVTVFNQEKYSGKFVVQADGSFTYTSVGRVSAAGKTVRALETELHELLAKNFLRDPKLSVVVADFRSQKISVLGQVKSQGVLEFTGAMNLIDALARVGGVTDQAGYEIQVTRAGAGSGGKPNVLRINRTRLESGDVTQNIDLKAGDQVFVPKGESLLVGGEVSRVGEVPFKPGMKIREAILLAGGITKLGSDRRIEIHREVNGKATTIKNAKMDDAVQAGDQIMVGQKRF